MTRREDMDDTWGRRKNTEDDGEPMVPHEDRTTDPGPRRDMECR